MLGAEVPLRRDSAKAPAAEQNPQILGTWLSAMHSCALTLSRRPQRRR